MEIIQQNRDSKLAKNMDTRQFPRYYRYVNIFLSNRKINSASKPDFKFSEMISKLLNLSKLTKCFKIQFPNFVLFVFMENWERTLRLVFLGHCPRLHTKSKESQIKQMPRMMDDSFLKHIEKVDHHKGKGRDHSTPCPSLD